MSLPVVSPPTRVSLEFALSSLSSHVRSSLLLRTQPWISQRIDPRRLPWSAAPPALLLVAFLGSPVTARAGGVQTLQPVVVTDAADNLVGTADSSTEGTITPEQLADRPLLRTGELLEGVPGLLISQHSGEGKANQYYLRGINLDHGTDFAITVDDMPVNIPSHAHGQGYSDLNFVIPELLSGIQYRKGPYFADEGDFSAVGAAHLNYTTELQQSVALVTIGTDSYQRAFAGATFNLFDGKLTLAAEFVHDNGPWTNPDDFLKENGMVRFFRQWGKNTLTVDAMGYNGMWNATNQSALRAISEGLIGTYGTLDPADQGSSWRYSLSFQFQHTEENSVTKISAYVIDYAMDLYNDFTYFLENPNYGDQFHQKDRRIITGLKASYTLLGKVFGGAMDNTVGLQLRNDNAPTVGLLSVDENQLAQTEVNDHITITNVALYAQNRIQWSPKFRSVLGLRWDFFHWNVNANIPQNSGQVAADIGSPKLSLIFGPWAKTEFFINAGAGFHSNDIRSATERIDPQYNTSQPTVPPLERALGAEAGIRTAIVPHLQNELTFWYLHLASEQIFDGDHGVTVPSYPSNRYGIESATYYTPFTWLTFDADIAYSVARFIGCPSSGPCDPAGTYIPGSPTWVISAGASVDDIYGFFATVRMHYFGRRPLIDNNLVQSDSSMIFNARVGYKFGFNPVKDWRLLVDFFNVFDTKTADIDYYYVSRLPGEPPAGVNDIHTHPADPLEIRVTLKAVF